MNTKHNLKGNGDYKPGFWERNSELVEEIIGWSIIIGIVIAISFVTTFFIATFIRELLWLTTPEGAAYNLESIPMVVSGALFIESLFCPWTYIATIPIAIPVAICLIMMIDEI